jgi:hypothetical protein
MVAIDDQTLRLSAMANEVCLTTIVPPPNRTCNFSTSQGQLQLNLNLNEYTRSGGWVTTVNVTGTRTKVPSTLLYNPCGTMTCPRDSRCQGIEDASVWLCTQEADEVICSGYGLLEDEVGMELLNPGEITGGVNVLYLGDMRKWTQVSYVCDRTIGFDELILPKSVDIEQYELQFAIGSRSACADPFRTPVPPQTASPAPTPTLGPKPGRVMTGGAVFLAVVFVPAVFYIGIGVFVAFFATGIPSVPNEAFWTEFGDSVRTAVVWTRHCGKPPAVNERVS